MSEEPEEVTQEQLALKQGDQPVNVSTTDAPGDETGVLPDKLPGRHPGTVLTDDGGNGPQDAASTDDLDDVTDVLPKYLLGQDTGEAEPAPFCFPGHYTNPTDDLDDVTDVLPKYLLGQDTDDQSERAPPAEGLADAADVLPDYLNESDTGCDHPQVDVELLADAAAQIHNNLYEQISDASTKQDPPADWKAKVEAAGLCPNPMYASRKGRKPKTENTTHHVKKKKGCARTARLFYLVNITALLVYIAFMISLGWFELRAWQQTTEPRLAALEAKFLDRKPRDEADQPQAALDAPSRMNLTTTPNSDAGAGAAGGWDSTNENNENNRGYGAMMKGTFNLTQGEVLKILVGQEGVKTTGGMSAGGGGGTFVTRLNNMPLIIAGGGGGIQWLTRAYESCDGTTLTSGQKSYKGVVGRAGNSNDEVNAGGSDGHGATEGTGGLGGGGGGLLTNGGSGDFFMPGSGTIGGEGGYAFVNDGKGGRGLPTGYTADGGFGGGGAGSTPGKGSGGGGGYSGGGRGVPNVCECGGGGGSFNAGTKTSGENGTNAGPGYAAIVRLFD
uniref:Uncharacterized protein n=1 Tax=Branchiostoma floridae TaxID=7739 RepID=C3ZKC9_BRAFL|eukprot:XP_002591017.1 hypothetical protein BRAFLDRAFT_69430 [Branchiostoma floridae]